MAVYKDQDELMNTDWQSKINDAVSKGDYTSAAQYEQARNEKINASGNSKYSTTNNYSGWLDTTDYGAIGKQQMASGASADEVLQTYQNRLNKASGTVGLEKYANDSIQQEMLDYIMANQNKKQPYESNYSSQIDGLLNQILNREEFSYNKDTDPSYLAYEDMYRRLGDRAREDTLGDIASLNGGYASSWAATAASQAQNDYNQQLSNVIPELYDAAYNRYLNEDNLKRQDMGLLMDLDNTAYNRYRDDVGDSQWQQQFDWNKKMDEWNMTNTEATQKFDQLMSKWQLMGVADAEVAEALGVPQGATTESYYFNKAQLELSQQKAASSGSGGGGRSGSSSSSSSNESTGRTIAMDDIIKQARDYIDRSEDYIIGSANYSQVCDYVFELMSKYNANGMGLTEDDYFSICSSAGVPSAEAKKAYARLLKQDNGSTGAKDYAYYADQMGAASDPEAWLQQNKYSIPPDILSDLYNLLNY